MSFVQHPPELANQYQEDRVLRSYLRRVLPPQMRSAIDAELDLLGEHAAEAWVSRQQRARSTPALTRWNAWGERIDRIELTETWQQSRQMAARFGLIANGHDPHHGAHARIHQFAMVYLHHVASAWFTCPLAMTDGAVTCLKAAQNQRLIDRALPHYLSRDPEQFWISGQWMTETSGGSDVSGAQTSARTDEHGRWRLYGRKWFTSAVHADTSLVLARPDGAGAGARHLALFYLEPRRPDGRWRNLTVERLKDKLGTRDLPTAEVELQGTPAEPVGELNQGVRTIAPMLNVTRTWNAICAVAQIRRGIALARDYANRRIVFGRPLADQPLHQHTLAGLQADFEGAFHLAFYVAELLGRIQVGEGDQTHTNLLRMLTPLAKLWTGKLAVSITSEVLESFGGAGYVEDTGLPELLRDAQILPIWEGTTNVLALDFMRAMKGAGGIASFLSAQRSLLAQADHADLAPAVRSVRETTTRLTEWLRAATGESSQLTAGAREFSLGLARCFAASLLLRHAAWSLAAEHDPRAAAAARRFIAQGLVQFSTGSAADARILASDVHL